MPDYVKFKCTLDTFQPVATTAVRWLDQERDYDLAAAFWPENLPLTRGVWDEAHGRQFHYCAIIKPGCAVAEGYAISEWRIVAIAAEWRYTDHAWEVAAVRTASSVRQQGYGKAVVSFITANILANGRLATCTTSSDNIAMQRTAESVGFQQV
ncbi:MAG: GNAT family N-acetyltransferase [Anaerolineae bacterium]|nr:GNAT family N-acetyltransferase [Anaerolineae bacterium]